MSALGLAAVGVGAALGAWLRWALALAWNPLLPALPLGTLAANVIGGFLIGVSAEVLGRMVELPAEWRLFLVTGFLGGVHDFLHLLRRDGRVARARHARGGPRPGARPCRRLGRRHGGGDGLRAGARRLTDRRARGRCAPVPGRDRSGACAAPKPGTLPPPSGPGRAPIGGGAAAPAARWGMHAGAGSAIIAASGGGDGRRNPPAGSRIGSGVSSDGCARASRRVRAGARREHGRRLACRTKRGPESRRTLWN